MDRPILVSLPVHERSDVVLDQVININRYLPGCCIVIHISKGFLGDPRPIEQLQTLSSMWTVINPERLDTDWAGMIQTHLSNFRFVKSWGETSFSHIALHASNDMFIRHGAKEYIQQNTCGVQQFPAPDDMMWTPRRRARHDPQLKAIMNELGTEDMFGSQVEGTFYSFDMFSAMNELFTEHFRTSGIQRYLTKNDNDHNNTLYAREEIYFSTIASKLCLNPAKPYLFSEVMTGVNITPELIDKIRNGSLELNSCFEKRICETPYRLYDIDNLYAVKRVKRIIDNPIREYIRGLP